MKWKDFISVIDVAVSILPSFVSIIGTLPYFESPLIPLLFGTVTLLLLLGFFIHSNLDKKEKALAEILATGYFINFLEPLSKNIGKRTEVLFRDTGGRTFYDLNNISITIYLPLSSESLTKISDILNQNPQYVNIDILNAKDGTPFWARAINEAGQLKIADFPRTLFSLPRFVKISLGHKRSKKLKKYYESFADKLIDLLEDYKQDYVLRKVNVEKI